MVTVAFIWCFSCFNWFSYCRGNCICAGQGNTIVSHFVVQRGDFTVAIACVPCGPRRSLIYAWAWGFWVCWKLSAAEQIKPDCCHTLAVVSIFDWLRCLGHCPVLRYTAPLHLHNVSLTNILKLAVKKRTCEEELELGKERKKKCNGHDAASLWLWHVLKVFWQLVTLTEAVRCRQWHHPQGVGLIKLNHWKNSM